MAAGNLAAMTAAQTSAAAIDGRATAVRSTPTRSKRARLPVLLAVIRT